MTRTIIFLIGSLLLLPAAALYMAEPLTDLQWKAVELTGYTFLGFAMLCFVISEITSNYSQTDKLWSITPVIYAWQIAYLDDFGPRTLLMAFLVTVWGTRLTLNFARRGGYSLRFWEGDEDYRWAILQENPIFKSKKLNWKLFNLFFISLYQHGLIMLTVYPMILALDSDVSLGLFDGILAGVILFLVGYEAVADNQQWKFQNEKHTFIAKTGKPGIEFENGFNRRGLWNLSRHPNYFAEQSIWIVLYFFSVIAAGSWLNWTITGAMLLVLLFRGSSDFSEGISAPKYPAYADYQKSTPRFFPDLRKLFT